MKNAGKRIILPIFVLVSLGLRAHAGDESVTLTRQGDQIEVQIGGKPFTTYYFGADSPKPYLHPLRSAQGTIVTRGWPMVKDIPGESHDHPHHRAMFFAHGDINGIDFWAEGQPTRAQQTVNGKLYTSEDLPKGRTVLTRLDESLVEYNRGFIDATFNLVGPDGKVIGEETQGYVIQGDEHQRIIDCEFTIKAGATPLKMGDTKEGMFAIRVVKALEAPTGHMLNSNGGVGDKEIWGKRADWVDYSGEVAGENLGIAIFDNPINPKHPTYWHARGYGLFAVNPFGEHDFYNDPKRDGSITIEPGKSLTFRYRVLIHHGDAAQAHVAEAYREYDKISKTRSFMSCLLGHSPSELFGFLRVEGLRAPREPVPLAGRPLRGLDGVGDSLGASATAGSWEISGAASCGRASPISSVIDGSGKTASTSGSGMESALEMGASSTTGSPAAAASEETGTGATA
jgi:hypothetical protein